MIIQPLSGGQQASKFAARGALRAWLFIGLFVLAPLRASGQATFSEARPVETPPLHDLAIADLDGDDDPDLVAITANDEDADALVWFENDGTGQFAPAQTLLADLPRETRTLKAADLDSDSDPDLLIGNDALFDPGGLFWGSRRASGRALRRALREHRRKWQQPVSPRPCPGARPGRKTPSRRLR